jgi:hypothetical protein
MALKSNKDKDRKLNINHHVTYGGNSRVQFFWTSHLLCFTMAKKSHGMRGPIGQAKKLARTKAHRDREPQKIKAAVERDLGEFLLYQYLLHIQWHIFWN